MQQAGEATKKTLTPRGERTRAALVAAARTVFERDGFQNSRLTDITAEASCSTGTFYTYFQSKEEILDAVFEMAHEDMLHPGFPHVDADDDPVVVLEAANRAYFEAYRRNAKLRLVLEQVSGISPEFRDKRRARGRVFAERNARQIERLQERGLADPDVDPDRAARALSGMVSRMAYNAFALGDEAEIDELVETATLLWANAIKLASPVTRAE
ncbi:TetR/AcrR family transcriptional regulator [Gordonia sp. PP30]|uniref:TetR/AcrR family transcriptional regulator n=1 Tax=unclassified Gordonia (in: high G+C Gram-positive bacteria) TaxID=2657482 RepID=UPI001FFFB471|nr:MULTISPECIES: TetR/AcrR family transcriptional regulator [unclassified Gordonia (in: high G+C Gram-positive bacteria)]UQE74850.1 TetR/AcrR family transcriptional regulator [Gordonia sp. PP30]